MRGARSVGLCFIRGVRRRVPVAKPAEWVKDATTYSDTFATVVDPYTSPPYPEQDVRKLMQDNKEAVRKDAYYPRRAKFVKRKMADLNFDHIPIVDQVVVLFPGQGSQYVGMGSGIADCSEATVLFDKASEVLGYDLKKICLEGPKTKLDQTIYCQPAVFVASLAAWEKAKRGDSGLLDRVTHTAGFSVGEFCALVLAGVLKFEDALRLIKIRAEAMHECNQRISSGMLTVRVSAASQLDDAMAAAREVAYEKGELPICEIANFLFCGVKVVGASETCMQFLEQNQDRYTFKVMKRLQVSGAFHTRLMEKAVEPLRVALREVTLNRPIINVYSNYTGKIYKRTLSDIRSCIVQQVSSPVRWEQIQQLLYRLHQDYSFPTFMEVGPGRQLGAMLRQISKKAFSTYQSCSP